MLRGTGSVPLTRLDSADPELLEELLETVADVARRSAFTLGSEVEDFESEFAAYCETSHCVGVASGTDALALTLRALGIGAGDEVIVPANSFIATAEAVSLAGATPRFVDVDPVTHVLTAESVERAITPRTRCVMPVHLYGRTVELEPLMELARGAALFVVEDACQAHGARYRGRRVGGLADAGCFSFYPAKNLGAWGDGGAMVTNDPELADRVRLLRSHGESPRYHHRVVGVTGRLDALHAAILRVKLRRLDDVNAARRDVAARYAGALDGAPVGLPAPVGDGHDHVYHQYVITTRRRDALRDFLGQRGVGTGVHYPIPIHRSGAYAELGYDEGSLPVSELLADEILSLPVFPAMTGDEIDHVAEAIHDFGRGHGRGRRFARG
jgi:dTDP-3-amino-3,4,6-trideoxy-alpha-D-glucose transaminase